jgi:Protein of unknown function (DUF3349)
MQLAAHLQPILTLLRQVYPEGVPERDYLALLVVMQGLLSEENLAAVVAELVDGERVVVANDAAAADSILRPNLEDVKRIRAVLEANGLISGHSEL